MVRHVGLALRVLVLVVSRLGFAHALSSGTTTTTGGGAASLQPPWIRRSSRAPWCHARIDFTAANEFIAAHYGRPNDKYFPVHQQDHEQPINNAREGFWDPESGNLMEPSLSQCGFQLVTTTAGAVPPHTNDTKNVLLTHQKVDWTNSTSIRQIYLPALEKAVRFAYEGSRNDGVDNSSEVEQVFFWCPTLRRENAVPTARDASSENTPQSGYVTTAHIDTCVDAYKSLADLVHVVNQNRFPETNSLPVSALVHALQQHGQQQQRFAIVNAWRNIGTAPVQHAPLAFLPMRYYNNHHRRDPTAFPYGVPDFSTSRWYTYPQLQPDEVLLFAQYDRDAAFPSDLWHCALTNTNVVGREATPNVPARESFDVRCLVVFKDKVEAERDRWSVPKSCQMNFEQSRAFCQEQAENRQQR